MTDKANNPTPDGISVVLGTGLLKCSAAIGMMGVLQREQIPIGQLVGSGPGAIFGAAHGLGFSQEQTLALVRELVDFYDVGRISLFRRLQLLLPRLLGFGDDFGLLSGSTYQAIFQKYFGDTTFADLPVKLSVVATNLANGQRVVLTDGPLWHALSASCTIPGFTPPVDHKGQLLIGGAASEPLPLSVATAQGSEVIVVMGFDTPYVPHIKSLRAFIYQLNNLHENHLLESQVALSSMAYHSEIVPVIPKFGVLLGLADSHQLDHIVDKGAEATEDVLPYLKQLLTHSE